MIAPNPGEESKPTPSDHSLQSTLATESGALAMKSLEDALPESLDLRQGPDVKARPTIHSIPPEMIQEIFEKYTNDKSDHPGERLRGSYRRVLVSPGKDMGAMPLTHVCSKWRKLAIETPTLWSTISIGNNPRQCDLPLIELCLTRSGSVQLVLAIASVDLGEEASSQDASGAALSMIFSAAHRWNTVNLQLGQSNEMFVEKLGEFPLPSCLESARARLMGWSPDGTDKLAKYLSANPKINRIWLGGETQPQLRHFLTMPVTLALIPWTKLTSLDLDQIPTYILFLLLPHFDRLEFLNVVVIPGAGCCICPGSLENTEGYPQTPIRLPYLAVIGLVSYYHICPLLEYLTLPALRYLSLQGGMGLGASPSHAWGALDRLVQRSNCNIISLYWGPEQVIRDPAFLDRFADASTTSLKNLESLSLRNRISADNVWQFAQKEDGVLSLFPQLQSLGLLDCNAKHDVLKAVWKARKGILVNLEVYSGFKTENNLWRGE